MTPSVECPKCHGHSTYPVAGAPNTRFALACGAATLIFMGIMFAATKRVEYGAGSFVAGAAMAIPGLFFAYRVARPTPKMLKPILQHKCATCGGLFWSRDWPQCPHCRQEIKPAPQQCPQCGLPINWGPPSIADGQP